MRLREFQIPKNTWELVVNDTDKTEIGHDLVKLVQTAYSSTIKGSFVNSVKDVLPSDWQVFDWDDEPGVDIAIFYRKQRADEPWVGNKIQGIGHDGKPQSKQKAIAQVTKLVSQSGWWMESSSAMRLAMKGMNAPACVDERIISKLFPGSFIRMIDHETYIRKIDGLVMQETVFGNPVLKGMNESINPQVFRRGFEKTKSILNGQYILKAYHGALPYSPTKKIHQSENFHIDAFTAKGSKVGGVTYKVTDDSLEAVFVEVKPEYRRQGVAKEMYIFAKELGNDIIPSSMRIYNGNDFGKGIADLYKEELSEVDYTPGIEPLQISFETLVASANIIGDLDNRDVWLYDDGTSQIYFTCSKEVDGLIILAGNKLHGVKNYSGTPGLITMLIGFVTHRLKMKIVITKDEPLTSNGINWLCSLIKAGGRGLTIKDQTGEMPDADLLYQEWATAMKANNSGKTEITIESKIERKLRTKLENLTEGRLMPTTWFIGDKDIL